jgi:hypothetical protein
MRIAAAALIGALVPLTLEAPEPTPLSTEELRIARIQHHFDGALEMLARRDLADLSSAQRANRASLVRVLTEYRDAGAYPRNYDFPGSPTPYFVDRKTGILCAVANLMASTGRRDLVDRVAAADNNVWVAELTDNTEFRAWLDEHGLNLDEAARIQVPYVDDGGGLGVGPTGQAALAAASLGALATSTTLSIVNLSINRNGDNRFLTSAGTVTSVVALGVGFLATRDDRVGAGRLGAISLTIGAAGLLSSSRAATRYRQRATVSPIIPIGPQQGAGLSFQLTF